MENFNRTSETGAQWLNHIASIAVCPQHQHQYQRSFVVQSSTHPECLKSIRKLENTDAREWVRERERERRRRDEVMRTSHNTKTNGCKTTELNWKCRQYTISIRPHSAKCKRFSIEMVFLLKRQKKISGLFSAWWFFSGITKRKQITSCLIKWIWYMNFMLAPFSPC